MKGIYKITNIVNSKVYIGQSVNIYSRWYSHRKALNKNSHSNNHLQNAWNKYGESNFIFSIIEECEESQLTEREQYWIDFYGGLNSDNTYNNKDAGNKGHLSEQTRKKLSDINIGKTPWNKGLTAENDLRVAECSETLTHNILTNECKSKISNTIKKLHQQGVYDYKSITKKRLDTIKRNGVVRKDKGTKRGKRDKVVGEHISKAKLESNARKRELGLPLRVQEKKPIPMKITICCVCGKEFQQRRCRDRKTCSSECRNKQISLAQKGVKHNGKKIIGC